MLFYMGKPRTFFGVKQICRPLDWVGFSEPFVDKVEDYLLDTWVGAFCEWLHSKTNTPTFVITRREDCWSAYQTIAKMAVPLLLRLQADKHGSGIVDEEDVPAAELAYLPEALEDDLIHLRWDYVLEEMIWVMEQLANGEPLEDTFYTHPADSEDMDWNERLDAIEVDEEGLASYKARLKEGTRLFGKYFMNLWD